MRGGWQQKAKAEERTARQQRRAELCAPLKPAQRLRARANRRRTMFAAARKMRR